MIFPVYIRMMNNTVPDHGDNIQTSGGNYFSLVTNSYDTIVIIIVLIQMRVADDNTFLEVVENARSLLQQINFRKHKIRS